MELTRTEVFWSMIFAFCFMWAWNSVAVHKEMIVWGPVEWCAKENVGERWRTVRTVQWEASYCLLFLKYGDIFEMALCIMLHMDCFTWQQAGQWLLLFQFTVDGHPHILILQLILGDPSPCVKSLVKYPAVNIKWSLTMCKNGIGGGLWWGVPLSCIILCFMMCKSGVRMCVYASANWWSQEEMDPIILVTLIHHMCTLASYINMVLRHTLLKKDCALWS